MCLPIGDRTDYDIVVELDGKLMKVQVKYAGIYYSKDKTCRVGLRTTGGNMSRYKAKKYSSDAFDILFVYTARDAMYLIPWQLVQARNELFIEHPKYSTFKVTHNLQG